ncbi:putative cytochrome P450 [Rosa chinensis]|uniref:Putative cytochrome P450 n=1 Tax=Rosa chinensis TaxID=74649 RepID=A0A2P6PAQ1_ROSCH|nr:putative cytochrome P450 [Rosa chinensis]
MTNILFYGCKDVVLSAYGEYWGRVRKLYVVELLSLKRVQKLQFAREKEVAEIGNRIRKACLGNSSINLSDMLITTSNNILSRCVIGKRFVEENDNWFGEASRRLLIQLTTFSFGDFFLV